MPRSSAYFSVRQIDERDGKAVKRALDALPGVASVGVSRTDRCIAVDFDPTGVSREQISDRLAGLGLEVDHIRDRFR